MQKFFKYFTFDNLDIIYRLIFMTIILISFYYPIKNDLDRVLKFPYSIIYAIIAGLSVAGYVAQNKNSVSAEFAKKSNS
jgi:TctA family transporter